MAEQKKETRGRKPAAEEEERSVERSEVSKKGEELKEALDTLLDEIDEILEDNAEEFVASYVQRGGE
jgi:prokaryotic ubiquitin-like protein Pup